MNIITVTPINKGIFKEELSYFSGQDIPIGAVVSIPVKSKIIEALVLDSQSAAKLKSELKSSDFSLKKILEVKKAKVFLPAFLTACKKTASFHAVSIGQTIKAAIPQAVLSNLNQSQVKGDDEQNKNTDQDDGTIKQNKFILQGESEERLSYYKSWIRESFAKKQSVLLCLPTNQDVETYSTIFGPGIKDYTISFHSGLSAKKIWSNWKKTIEENHPLLIIATPGFLSIPREDLKTIIIEKENTSAYKNISRPHIDYRRLAEHLAEGLNARFILGDVVLRAETIFRAEQGEFARLAGLKYRLSSSADQFILDSRNYDSGDKNLYAIGDKLKDLLKLAIENKEKILLVSGRRGLSPQTVCNDCGEIVNCSSCHSPLVLHKNPAEKKYIYLCHKCGRRSEVTDKCASCDSWRLTLLGFGIEKVEEELAELLPDIPLFKIDSDSLKPSKRSETVEKFYTTKGPAILLGTEIILPLVTDKIPNVIITAIDGLFSLPDFRISEKVFNLLLQLRSLSGKRFAIQTRNPQEKVFNYAISGNLIEFYREEIEERLKFGYPPFKILIKISHEETPAKVEQDMETISDTLADYSPTIFPSFFSSQKGKKRLNILIKTSPKNWPNAQLEEKLRSLSPDYVVDIEPESIL